MFKEVFSMDIVRLFTQLGLVIFFLVFVAVSIWAYTRPKREVDNWAEIPLSDSDENERRA